MGQFPGFAQHGHHIASTGFAWSTFWQAVAAVAALTALVGGAVVAYFFGRKATTDLEAKLYETPGGLIVAVRPSVTAVGFRAFRFHTQTSSVTVVPQRMVAGKAVDTPEMLQTLPSAFGPRMAMGGETISTSVIFPVHPPGEDVIGWKVDFHVVRKHRFGRGKSWDDRVFVPASPDSHG